MGGTIKQARAAMHRHPLVTAWLIIAYGLTILIAAVVLFPGDWWPWTWLATLWSPDSWSLLSWLD
ncbi:hypothetical protein [Mycolicibacterium helvum]|uniref:Uncharacterized protein n=1 Tax=Mycolicibacterium helvum TaxID=1534349 RepID=A0A7I7T1G5_9MYCO|nr:hypothetical protein [Mycolicibacterium helvum]BBY63117.1 hypothetical protein MHEL_13600 [Mycolicibacterium helvum]